MSQFSNNKSPDRMYRMNQTKSIKGKRMTIDPTSSAESPFAPYP